MEASPERAPPPSLRPAVARYLDRLGVGAPATADVATLRRLHRAHLERVPFENLSIHLGEPIVLEEGALVAKIVERRRGGFCYELNGAFAWLLRALGYQVAYLEARVFQGERPGPPFDHMALRVELERPWLVDVGFGRNFIEPLPLEVGTEQIDESGSYRLADAGGGAFDLFREGEAQYRLSAAAPELAAYEAMCRHHQTSPESHFPRNVVCSLPLDGGRVSLSGRRLLITDRQGRRTERSIDDDAELLDVYRRYFGIELATLPALLGGSGRAAG